MHGTMRCCGREKFRLYVSLYRKISWYCNWHVSNYASQVYIVCVTLVVRRRSCTMNQAALLFIFFMYIHHLLTYVYLRSLYSLKKLHHVKKDIDESASKSNNF